MRSVVDSYDESKVQALEIQMKAQQERLLAIQDARGSQREVEASLTSVRSEVKAQIDGLNTQMKAIQKSMTNPIGN
jgi:hypothetical protein